MLVKKILSLFAISAAALGLLDVNTFFDSLSRGECELELTQPLVHQLMGQQEVMYISSVKFKKGQHVVTFAPLRFHTFSAFDRIFAKGYGKALLICGGETVQPPWLRELENAKSQEKAWYQDHKLLVFVQEGDNLKIVLGKHLLVEHPKERVEKLLSDACAAGGKGDTGQRILQSTVRESSDGTLNFDGTASWHGTADFLNAARMLNATGQKLGSDKRKRFCVQTEYAIKGA